MWHGKYTGNDPDLIGHTALCNDENGFQVQVDEFTHKFSHGWFVQDPTDWAPMSNVLVQNENELPIWGLRLLGLSVKDADKIGKFGTGLKEAIALSNRLGVLPVIFSGTCRITFSVRHEPAELGFTLTEDRDQFKAGEWYGLGMHPDFGKLDWTETWMVFREIVCNAIDEGGLYHDITQSMEGKAGCTRVYIPATTKMIASYAALEDRLMMLGKHKIIEVTSCGSIIEKRTHPGLQVYHRGVWIQETDVPSVYDYEFNTLKLNESRSADWHAVRMQLACVIADMQPDELELIMRKAETDEAFAERDVFNSLQHLLNVDTGERIVTTFIRMHGTDAIACPNDRSHFNRIEERGMTPVVIKDSLWFRCLKCAGVQVSENLVSSASRAMEDSFEADEMLTKQFTDIWSTMKALGLTRDRIEPDVRGFKEYASAVVTHGRYYDGVCYINVESGSSDRLRAIVEEISHHVTGASDMTRSFQTYLVDCMTNLIILRENTI